MDHVKFGIGAVWILLTLGAAALLGTEFILQEIHTYLKHRREREAE